MLDLSPGGDVWTETVLCSKECKKNEFFPGFLLKTKNKMKDRTKRKRKTEKKADVKARAESSVNESEEFPVL